MEIDTLAFIFRCLIAGVLIFFIVKDLLKTPRRKQFLYYGSKYNYRNPE